MSRQVSPSTGRVYGLQRVARLWGLSRATVYRHRRPAALTRKRPGPLGADGGRGPGRGDPAAPGGQPVPRRGLPQAVGQAALCRCPHQPTPGSPAHARARPAGPPACRPAARSARPRRHDRHRAGRCDVGHRPDLGHDRRGSGRGVRRGRSLLGRVRRHSRQPPGRSLRGARADQAGRARALRRVRQGRRRRPAAAPRSREPVREPPLPGRDPLPRHRELARPSCASPKATAAPSGSSGP